MQSNLMQSMFCREQKLALSVALILGFILSGSSLYGAEGTKFPYDASIFTDDVEVHSGPGSKFYVTGKLKKGTAIRVHRHDPGGWYMVAPPAGSFSLVRAEYVKKESPKQGVVTENSVVVRVGSQLNDHQEVEQRRLMKGERVSIIGEHHYTDRGRTILMLKIEPPRGEFRWVKGEFVVPNDPSQRKIHDADPYAFPSNGIEVNPDNSKPDDKRNTPAPRPGKSIADDKSKLPRPGFDPSDANEGVASSGFDPQLLQRDRSILDALDRNFRDMIQQDISTWNLRDLAHDYKKLQNNTPVTPIASQVDLRLQAMERYRKMKAEYDDLVKLTSGTEMRDAQLLSMQKTTDVGAFPQENFGPGDDPRLAMAPGSSENPNFPFPGHLPGASHGNGFSGAGIVKKVGNWDGKTPAYVLVSPSDKLLSYLEPVSGVNLEQAVGQSVGVYGNRRGVAELRADLIHVTGLSPVRLQQR